jgi:hypothetical protein
MRARPRIGRLPEKIRELLNLLKPNSIHGFVLRIPIKSTVDYDELKKRWRNGNRYLYHEVLQGLRSGTLMSFGEPMVIEVN